MFTNRHLPRFNKVCFCCPLRTGNIVLVFINLILSVVLCSVCLFIEYVKLILRLFYTSSEFNWLHRMVRFKTVPFAAAILMMAYSLAEICMTVVVMVGFHKNRYKYILVYMYYTIFTSIMMALSRTFDMENEVWYIELGPDVVYYVFKAYYVLSIRSQIKIMHPSDVGDELNVPRDIEMKMSTDEVNEADLNVQSVVNIEKILNDETLDSEYENSEFGSADALLHVPVGEYFLMFRRRLAEGMVPTIQRGTYGKKQEAAEILHI